MVIHNKLNSGVNYQKFQHVFHKGNDTFNMEGIATASNGPGLYLKQIVIQMKLNIIPLHYLL